MKDLEEQIKFLDEKLLPIFGIRNIIDYSTTIHLDKLSITLLDSLNDIIDEFRKIYPVKDFNLHKSEYRIKSIEQAFSLLKKCLQISLIQFEKGFSKKSKYLRLIPKNNILDKYINKMEKMSSERNFCEKTNLEFIENVENMKIITNKEFFENIKKEHTVTFIIQPKHFFRKQDCSIVIDLKNFNMNFQFIKSYIINVESRKKSDIDIVCKSYIDKMLSKCTYEILLGGSCIYDNTYPKNGEIVPENFMFLNGFLDSHESLLSLRNFDENVLDLLHFKIAITYVDFYTPFVLKANKSTFKLAIKKSNDLVNEVHIRNGIGCLHFASYMHPDKFKTIGDVTNLKQSQFSINKKVDQPTTGKLTIEEYFKQYDIQGSEIKIGKLNGFFVSNSNSNSEDNDVIPYEISNGIYKCFRALYCSPLYDFTMSVSQILPISMNKYYAVQNQNNYLHTLHIPIPRKGDLTRNLSVIFDRKIIGSQLSMTMHYVTNIETEIPIKLKKIGENDFVYTNDNEIEKYHSLLSGHFGLEFILAYTSESNENPYENINMTIDYIFLPTIVRAKIASNEEVVFDAPMLEKYYC